jgi:hypothetical protein
MMLARSMFGLWILLIAARFAWGQPSYTVTDLGSIFPMSVKGDGAVIGSAVISGTQTPIVWVGGQIWVLDTLGYGGRADQITNEPAAVGYVLTSQGTQQAAHWNAQGLLTLLAGVTPALASAATAKNAAGVITGYGDTPALLIRAKRWWPSGTMENLATLGGYDSYTIAIDATSRDWGSADTLTRTHAAVWDVDGTVHDLVTLGGIFATVLGVNDSGLAVGFSLTADDRVMGMYFTHPGGMGALPLLEACAEPFIECTAEAINNIPQAVGSCWTITPSPLLVVEHAALWNADGTVVDLNTQIDPGLGWVLQDAQSIDDSGHIVGSGLLHGQRRDYLLTPQLPAMAVTPADTVMSVWDHLPPSREKMHQRVQDLRARR